MIGGEEGNHRTVFLRRGLNGRFSANPISSERPNLGHFAEQPAQVRTIDRYSVESCQSSARNRHSADARQIYNSENRPGSGIADKVNALPVPVVVEVSPLQGI